MSMPVPNQMGVGYVSSLGWRENPGGRCLRLGSSWGLWAPFPTEVCPSPGALTPSTSECDLIWKWVAADVISQDEVMLGGEQSL